jgi:fluoride ion exporter CrcB/FEX
MTTFSTFSVDVVKFVEKNEFAKAGMYILGSNVTGIGAAYGGYAIARKVIRK